MFRNIKNQFGSMKAVSIATAVGLGLLLGADSLTFAQAEEGELPSPPKEGRLDVSPDGHPEGNARRAGQGERWEERRELRQRMREIRRSNKHADGDRREHRDGMRERFGKGNGPGQDGMFSGDQGPRNGGQGNFRKGRGPRAGAKLGGYLEAVQSYQKAVQDPKQAIGLAVLGIREYYRKDGKPLEAIKEIEGILQSSQDQGVRNIALFAMRQIYEEERMSEKLLEMNKQILRENLGAVSKSQ